MALREHYTPLPNGIHMHYVSCSSTPLPRRSSYGHMETGDTSTSSSAKPSLVSEPQDVSREHVRLLFIHGWPEFWYTWHRVMPGVVHGLSKVLNSSGRSSAVEVQAVAVDLPGFGRTRVPKKNELRWYTWKTVAESLVLLMDELGWDKAVVVCHDWGGAVGWRMAARFPERVNAVAALCTAYRPRSRRFVSNEEMAKRLPAFTYQHYFSSRTDEAAKELDANVRRMLLGTFRSSRRGDHGGVRWMAPGSESFLSGFPAEEDIPNSDIFPEEHLQVYVRMFQRRGFRESLNWYCTAKLNWEDDAELPKRIAHKALMLSALKDPVLSPALTKGMEEWVPRLDRASVEAAHWLNAEQPEAVIDVLVRWMTDPEVHHGKPDASVLQARL